MGDAEQRIVKILPGLGAVSAADWDACANPDPGTYNPFLSHGFLGALEQSGAVGPGTGWMAHHLVIEEPDGTVQGVMPLYSKTHS